MLKEKYIVDLYDIENDLIQLHNSKLISSNNYKRAKINEYKLKTLQNNKKLIEFNHNKKHNLYRIIDPVKINNDITPFSEIKISNDSDIGNLFTISKVDNNFDNVDIFKDYINYEPDCKDDIYTGDIEKYIMCLTETQKKRFFLKDRKNCINLDTNNNTIDDIADCLRKNYVVSNGKDYLLNGNSNKVLNDDDIDYYVNNYSDYKICKNNDNKIDCMKTVFTNLKGDDIQDVSGNIVMDNGDIVLEDSDTDKNFIINGDGYEVTSEGIEYRLSGIKEPEKNTSYTMCGETNKLRNGMNEYSLTNKSEGYEMEIKHKNSDKTFKICIYGKGEIEAGTNKIKQMTKSQFNTWYKYDDNKNICVDWGIYIPHSNTFALDKMVLTNKFVVFKRLKNYGSVNKRSNAYFTQRVMYDDKYFCESVNQKKLGKWYFYDDYIKGCREYTSKGYEFDEPDLSNIQFNRLNDGKKKNEKKLNLYNDFRYCNDMSKPKMKYDAFKYDIKNNTCIFQGKLDEDLFVGDIKNKVNCDNMIKYNSFIYDESINECIENTLICDKYGNKKKCTLEELKNSGKNYYLNLDDCISNDIRGKYYFFNPYTEKCEEKKLTTIEKEELDAILDLYSLEEDCLSR